MLSRDTSVFLALGMVLKIVSVTNRHYELDSLVSITIYRAHIFYISMSIAQAVVQGKCIIESTAPFNFSAHL